MIPEHVRQVLRDAAKRRDVLPELIEVLKKLYPQHFHKEFLA